MSNSYIHKPKVRTIIITVKDKGQTIESLRWNELPMKLVIKWGWYFRYREALLQVKYPRFHVSTNHYNIEPEGRSLERIKADLLKKNITSTKRMITKLTNAIAYYEKEESKLLIPNWEDPKYLKAKVKLENYKNKLIELTS